MTTAESPPKGKSASWFRHFPRDPIWRFLLAGLLLYGLDLLLGSPLSGEWQQDLLAPHDHERTIVLSRELVASFAQSATGPRTEQEQQAAREAYVRKEVLVREARRLGLDRSDLLVRSRLVQKMEYILEESTHLSEPSTQELQSWLHEHRERYLEPARVSFQHLYFSTERRGEQARPDAMEALDETRYGGSPPGDPFLHGAEIPPRTRRELASTFGGSFAETLMSLPVGRWEGPVESRYGFHLVKIHSRSTDRLPEVAEINAQLRRDLLVARQADALKTLEDRLISNYIVVLE